MAHIYILPYFLTLVLKSTTQNSLARNILNINSLGYLFMYTPELYIFRHI